MMLVRVAELLIFEILLEHESSSQVAAVEQVDGPVVTEVAVEARSPSLVALGKPVLVAVDHKLLVVQQEVEIILVSHHLQVYSFKADLVEAVVPPVVVAAAAATSVAVAEVVTKMVAVPTAAVVVVVRHTMIQDYSLA
jgi:hypothetical protein